MHRSTADDRDTRAARAEAQRLRADLEDHKKLAETGEIKAVDFVRFERALTASIAEAEAAAQDLSIPPALRGRIGKHAARGWASSPTTWRSRETSSAVLSIELLRAGRRPAPAGPGHTRMLNQPRRPGGRRRAVDRLGG